MKQKPKYFEAWKNGRERFNTDPDKPGVIEQIELILTEAGAYGVRKEVDVYAKRIIYENHDVNKVLAYQMAYKEYTKEK